jgi:hypothetical protein
MGLQKNELLPVAEMLLILIIVIPAMVFLARPMILKMFAAMNVKFSNYQLKTIVLTSIFIPIMFIIIKNAEILSATIEKMNFG